MNKKEFIKWEQESFEQEGRLNPTPFKLEDDEIEEGDRINLPEIRTVYTNTEWITALKMNGPGDMAGLMEGVALVKSKQPARRQAAKRTQRQIWGASSPQPQPPAFSDDLESEVTDVVLPTSIATKGDVEPINTGEAETP